MNNLIKIDYLEKNTLISLLKLFPDKSWNWEWLSENPNTTIDIVLEHPDKPTTKSASWCWRYLSENPNTTIDIVLAHSQLPLL